MVTVTSPKQRIGPARIGVLAIASLFIFVAPMSSRPAASTGPLATTTAAVVTGSTTATLYATTASAPVRTMRSLINQTRSLYNRVGLRLNSQLSLVAQRHSAKMAKLNRLHHNPNLVKDVGDMPWKILGENVGVGSTVNTLHKAFMNSPSHRANILRSAYRLVGIGVVSSGGRTWVTVVFYG